MSDRIDTRYPNHLGTSILPSHAGIKSPWDKIVSFHDAFHYAIRTHAGMGASFMQVMRILIPNYEERCTVLCTIARDIALQVIQDPDYGVYQHHLFCSPPFVKGSYFNMLSGDWGDEFTLAVGRVNDYGPHRVEKELDTCPYEIVGSEMCRVTTSSLETYGKAFGDPFLEMNMVEAKGCGDLHCRIVAEDRKRYPMPPKEHIYDVFGPVATADEIKFTPEERCIKEPFCFDEDCDFKYRNGFCSDISADDMYQMGASGMGPNMLLEPILYVAIEDKEKLLHVVKCVFETAGKAAFVDFAAVKGIRDWLGVPSDINDGRVLGAYIEMQLQACLNKYEVIAFNKEEVILDITHTAMERQMHPLWVPAKFAMWNGMVKTLVSARWFVDQITEDVPEDIIRLKIHKKN